MPVDEQSVGRSALRDADERSLLTLVRSQLDQLSAAELRAVFSNPFVTESVVREILDRQDYLENREIRRALVAHRHTPLPDALRLVQTLFWRDLVDLGREATVKPQVRRAAHQALYARYEGLSVGERVSIARRAGVDLLARVRHDPEPRVILAMLENPRLTEGALLPVLASGATRPDVLRGVAASERWVARYQVRRLLCRNRRTPGEVAMSLLPRLKKGDLRAVESNPGLDSQVRRRAAVLLGKSHAD